jgi:hypothetical protein
VIFDLVDAIPFRRPQRAPQLFGSDRPAARAQGIAWLTPHALDANGAQIRRTYLLPAGDRLDDTLIVSLTRGLRPRIIPASSITATAIYGNGRRCTRSRCRARTTSS